jgi:threonine/homoserine/homoserine lactone efflux protein
MPPDLLIALIGFAVASSITPGPNNLLVLTSGLNHGVPRSLPLIAGISFGFAFMLVVIGIGLGSVIRTNASLHTAAKVFGLVYMLWLAWKVASSTPSLEVDNGQAARPLSAVTGVTFQWVNPKAWAIALTATAAFSAADAAMVSLAWIVGVFLMISFGSLSAWAAFGSLMRRLIDTPAKLRAFNMTMALLLLASALPVAYDLWTTS